MSKPLLSMKRNEVKKKTAKAVNKTEERQLNIKMKDQNSENESTTVPNEHSSSAGSPELSKWTLNRGAKSERKSTRNT